MGERAQGKIRLLAVTALGASLLLLLLSSPASAHPGDPGRWLLASETHVPLEYFQGITVDPRGELFFDGIHTGLYGAKAVATDTGWKTEETARNADVIPADVRLTEGYNHIGDLTWAPDEGDKGGGRLLLPLECFHLGVPKNGGNVCHLDASGDGDPEVIETPGRGAIGVAVEDRSRLVKGVGDKLVHTFEWRYHVPLAKAVSIAPDGVGMTKAMWAEISPDGDLLWTQASDTSDGGGLPHLLAYDVSAITRANAEPGAGPLEPEVFLQSVLALGEESDPIKQVSGATFVGDRLYVAGQRGGTKDIFEVWSLDVRRCKLITRCDARLELHRHIVGESEGLATGCVLGGFLHWQIAPYNTSTSPVPTYWMTKDGVGKTTLLSFVPASAAVARAPCD